MESGKKKNKSEYESKNGYFGVSSMVSSLKTVGMLKPMESLKRADPKKWHYGHAFDPIKIKSSGKDCSLAISLTVITLGSIG